VDHVSRAVGEIQRVVQRVAAQAEESASASEELSAQAELMKGAVQDLRRMVS
jgi:methyl-accepting chemotaxis protein